MNGPTEAQMLDIFEGPAGLADTSLGSSDWLLPTYQQPYYASQFPEGTFTGYLPEPAPRTGAGAWDWLTPVAQPFVNFGQTLYKESVEPAVKQTYEKLPELLWGWGLEKAGVIDRPREVAVDEGAGVVVTHTQPPHAGGEPAKPITASIPQLFPAWSGAVGGLQAKETSSMILIGLAGVVLYVIFFVKDKG